jgi:tRNA-uridine 2-sulfurtransferase
MTKKRIIVAMSGGVDSSVTAALLLKKGYEIIGVTFDFKIKCSELAVKDAQIIAKKLGIQHYVIDCEKAFKKNVINYFSDTYAKGKTPNPCAKCNREIKFAELIKFMKKLEADYVATGHYVKIVANGDQYELYEAKDKTRDQSYFLSFLKYEYLQYIKFPLEEATKQKVRDCAAKFGFHVANKPSSQDICFINENYKSFLAASVSESNKKGDILHINGKKLGEHNGIMNYTIGQRKGLGIGYTESLYVVKIDINKNIVYVGSNKDLYSSEINLYDLNLLDLSIKSDIEYEFRVKLRSTHKGDLAKVVFNIKNNSANIRLLKPTRAVTKGQLCAFYDGERVIGSGWIS